MSINHKKHLNNTTSSTNMAAINTEIEEKKNIYNNGKILWPAYKSWYLENFDA